MTDEAHVTVEVEIEPATAFDLFTRDIAAWWRADRSLWGRRRAGHLRARRRRAGPRGRHRDRRGSRPGSPGRASVFSYGGHRRRGPVRG